ncbi:GNAT family N-acetyltransferase [Lysinibacillus xylanilyticus]|uniref:GNAT family N-acetyltransferase n=1 Tax=Lysinibacillus xylanilyticus TaxID=582475 RepID=UPI002B244433|nr:GNAT family N-acetyltransferase [Lysinibacillus xylanilyticus]MEB2279236.1 GNAT family N-acetyltransferase [Lysinibacillus xylanilyticus]
MDYIQITRNNIEQEHICCALGSKQYEEAVKEKKEWLMNRMDEGLVFYRLNARAKVFIEYLPANQAWVPIDAPNYMYINCLWVSGKFKNQNHARQLIEKCKEDALAQGMDGIVHIVGEKKLPFLSDKRFFEQLGFEMVDQAAPYFQLAVYKFNDYADDPSFKLQAKNALSNNSGIVIYFTAQCPFAVGVIDDLKKMAEKRGIPFHAYQLRTKDEAQNAPIIWTTFGLFYNGHFITHEILSPNKFEKLLNTL